MVRLPSPPDRDVRVDLALRRMPSINRPIGPPRDVLPSADFSRSRNGFPRFVVPSMVPPR